MTTEARWITLALVQSTTQTSVGETLRSILRTQWTDYRKDLFPRDRRMRVLHEKGVAGMNSENIRFLINEIVRKCAKDGTYLEVGVLKGASLLSAALFNESTRCIGIDNFSQFDTEGTNEEQLYKNLAAFNNPSNIEMHNADYRDVIPKIFTQEPGLKVNVYFYDGLHTYQEQLNGLEAMMPYYSDSCIILVDDWNLKQVRQANRDFIRARSEFRSIVRIPTVRNGAPDWWNGLEVIARDATTRTNEPLNKWFAGIENALNRSVVKIPKIRQNRAPGTLQRKKPGRIELIALQSMGKMGASLQMTARAEHSCNIFTTPLAICPVRRSFPPQTNY